MYATVFIHADDVHDCHVAWSIRVDGPMTKVLKETIVQPSGCREDVWENWNIIGSENFQYCKTPIEWDGAKW